MAGDDVLVEGAERLCEEIDRALERDVSAPGPESDLSLASFVDQISVVLEMLAERKSSAANSAAVALRMRLGDLQQRKIRKRQR